MKANQQLLHHPLWAATDPSKMRLIRIFELPDDVNQFAADGVVLKVAAAAGEAPYHKWSMGRDGILTGIREGLIVPGTTVVEATSGNTGHKMGIECNRLGLNFVAIIASDVPGTKIDALRALGGGVSVRNPDPGETTVECARRLGAQEGWYNPDQYGGEWNPRSHYEHLAPQLFGQTRVSIFALPGGTMGTSLGVGRYVRDKGLKTKVVPVMCAEGQEIPAARTLKRIKKDIRLPWEEFFTETDIQFGTRYASFLLSYLTWRLIPVQLGPSFGLALVGALKFLRAHKNAMTLDQFRDSRDDKIHVVVLGPDDYRAYIDLYLALRLYDGEFARGVPNDLLSLVDRK